MNRSHIIILVLLLLLILGGVGYVVKKWDAANKSSQTTVEVPTGARQPATRQRVSPTPVLIEKLTDPSLHLDDQLKAVRDLPADLSSREISALVDLLRQPSPQKTSKTKWYTLLNELMGVLAQPRFKWQGYSKTMGDLMVDQHIDPVVRDYAAQHLAVYLGRNKDGLESFAEGMSAFLVVLKSEREASQSVMGTTLMMLADLQSRRAEEDFQPYDAELSVIITAYASGTRKASLPNQISAIQAAGRMNYREALPAIRQYAVHGASNQSIRLSSIAALGYYGAPEDLEFLKQMASSNDKLRFAAQTALDNHQHTNSQTN